VGLHPSLRPQAASTPELLEAAGRSPEARTASAGPSAAGAAGRLSEECQVCGVYLRGRHMGDIQTNHQWLFMAIAEITLYT
jgi:hypothetical protein